ncbi:MAG: S8 family serine peptidase [Nitrospirae bacterium]|nr:S8 family serine peptidase [Nitrospirota bacterium]
MISAAPILRSIQAARAGGELLVRFHAGISPAEVRAVLSRRGMTILKSYRHVSNLYHVRLPSVLNVEAAIEILKGESAVQYAEPNYTVQFDSACTAPCTPNDTLYSDPNNWGFVNVGAPEAWTVTTGDGKVVVAVLDTGIDYTHPDLINNVWTNPTEIPGNGIDDDGDGYIDDIHGYNATPSNFCSTLPCSAGDPMDDDTSSDVGGPIDGHGTRLAGIIGAVGNNNMGIAGVNWRVKLMAIKIRYEPDRQSSLDLVLAGIDYLIAKRKLGVNIKVANFSFGVSSWSQSLQDGIDAVRDAGILLISTAGNTGTDVDAAVADPTLNDFHRVYDNVLFVGAIDTSNALAKISTNGSSFSSSYGQIGIQLAAPGVGILSTIRTFYNPIYASADGTSFSAPFVTGVAALLAAFDPSLTYSQLKARIISATTPTPALSGKVASGGRLNAAGVFTAPITDLAPAGYQLARVASTQKFYLDRSYTVVTIPAGFDGLWWVRTRNDDKANANDSYIQLGLGQPAAVYVAFDPNATQVPDWLGPAQQWTDTGRNIGVSVNGGSGSLKLYSRPFNAGSVTLGGPLASGYAGPAYPDNTNYVVLVRMATGDADTTAPSINRLDGYDLVTFSLAMGSSVGASNWCAACDLDGSGTIDSVDLSLFMDNFGKSL